MKKVFVIVGPTASGKSGFAIQLAQHLNGQIVNADSMQIYQDLSIVSARPQDDDLQKVPHHLYGYLDAWTQGTVQDWLERVVPVLNDLENPVLVGGTGLYLSCLINGINDIPEIDSSVREKVRKMDLHDVQTLLKDCPWRDPQRMRRSLEVQLSTGHPLSYYQNQPKRKFIAADFYVIFINPPRSILYQNCEKRFHQMIEQGGIEEVEHLLTLKPTGGVLKAIGVPEIISYLQGDISKQDMCQKAILSTRHYAKRQITWFRHQLLADKVIQKPTDFNFSTLL